MGKYFVGFWNASVVLTYAELAIAVTGICQAAGGNVWPAVICLMTCGLCDMYDGKIARAIKRNAEEKTFGIQIDSLCDLVSFGVLPSVIGYACGIRGYGVIVLVFYTLCALIRLGYFNVTEQKRQQETNENRKYFEGLPVTTAAVIIPLGVLLSIYTGRAFPWVFGAILVITGFLFIYRFQVKKIQL